MAVNRLMCHTPLNCRAGDEGTNLNVSRLTRTKIIKRNPNGTRFLNGDPNRKKTLPAFKILNESDFFFQPRNKEPTKLKTSSVLLRRVVTSAAHIPTYRNNGDISLSLPISQTASIHSVLISMKVLNSGVMYFHLWTFYIIQASDLYLVDINK